MVHAGILLTVICERMCVQACCITRRTKITNVGLPRLPRLVSCCCFVHSFEPSGAQKQLFLNTVSYISWSLMSEEVHTAIVAAAWVSWCTRHSKSTYLYGATFDTASHATHFRPSTYTFISCFSAKQCLQQGSNGAILNQNCVHGW